jgi:hypothetical protein
MRNPLMTHYQEFASSADLDGVARTVEAKYHWLERSFWVDGPLKCLLKSLQDNVLKDWSNF